MRSAKRARILCYLWLHSLGYSSLYWYAVPHTFISEFRMASIALVVAVFHRFEDSAGQSRRTQFETSIE